MTIRKGDLAFFYHSNCVEPGIYGVMRVVRESYPDHTQFDSESRYYDPKSNPGDPRWLMVDVQFKRKMKRAITLQELKAEAALADMLVVRRGNRLSVTPVNEAHWEHILCME